ncbi:DMT family transporter [Vibrio metschnikovii]|uniref:DMT family transporter n=1 Tax=Vibrio metschnikovii TaxID=28172 RepID=UPI001C305914|nr:SMR family transporter [Vibrio metschnikovii]EKO3567036.1 QacE family quaternary ammonium compound efflux SMR transporter [Vibrio metschnikovii]EKO3771306.1 QacE family quaternary ammonium compound efflux SMR transporter [Vibrio metschnikovii]
MTLVYIFLILAILTEVTATLLLKASNGWEKWWFGMGAIFFYSIAGMTFAFVLKSMSVGLAYAIWSGAGIALVCVASVLIWQQKFDIYALAGVMLIALGTGLITLKSSVALQ